MSKGYEQEANEQRAIDAINRRFDVIEWIGAGHKEMQELDTWLDDQRSKSLIWANVKAMKSIIGRMVEDKVLRRVGGSRRGNSAYMVIGAIERPTEQQVRTLSKRRGKPSYATKPEHDKSLCAFIGFAYTQPRTEGNAYTPSDTPRKSDLRSAPKSGIQSSMGYML
jgi:hypothetical protein